MHKSHATHQALITCIMSCATWYKGTAQLRSLTELKSHLFNLFYGLKPLTDEGGGRKSEYPRKTPGGELQKGGAHSTLAR